MRTVILEKPGQFSLTDTELPTDIKPGEAVVHVDRIGICGTDLHAYRGRQPFFSYPRILGHELGVEIVELAGPSSGLSIGDWCAVEPYLNCGKCLACFRGKPNCCVDLRVLGVHTDGGMREYLVVPTHKLHRSESLTLDQLALIETLGIGAHAVDRAALEPRETVLVVGVGPIGLSVVQFACLAGARVIILDQNPQRLDFCRRHFNVEYVLDGSQNPIVALGGLLSGELPTTVFDATGNAQSMMQAFRYVANGGKLVLVGLVQADVTFHDPDFHRRELTLLASRNSTPADFKRIIGLMEEGRIDTTCWITHRCNLQELIVQFPTWLEPETGVVKAMVEI